MAIFEYGDEIDAETLDNFLEEYGERPSDAAFWDDRLYTSHFPILGWADRGDDILSESNYRRVLEDLEAIDKDSVIDASIKHWAVGSLRQIFVQAKDENGNYLPVFAEAVTILISLRDNYPLYDESDYSELEMEYTDKAFNDEFDWMTRNVEFTEDQKDATYAIWEESYYGYREPGYVDPDELKESAIQAGIVFEEED